MDELLNCCPKCGSTLEFSNLMQYSDVYKITRSGKLSKKRIIKRIKEVKYLYKNNYINLETFFTSINTFLNIYKVNKGVIYRNINKYIFNKSSEFNK